MGRFAYSVTHYSVINNIVQMRFMAFSFITVSAGLASQIAYMQMPYLLGSACDSKERN